MNAQEGWKRHCFFTKEPRVDGVALLEATALVTQETVWGRQVTPMNQACGDQVSLLSAMHHGSSLEPKDQESGRRGLCGGGDGAEPLFIEEFLLNVDGLLPKSAESGR